MHNKTLLVLSLLSVIAALLIGINIGKKLSVSQYLSQFAPNPTPFASPQPTGGGGSPTPISVKSGKTTVKDESCGFTISYVNDPSNPVITTCQQDIPKPPLTPDKIEDITLDGVPAKLYHDASSKDGSPRDEVIVKHPTLNHEIILAGFGPSFNEAVASFKFLR